MSQVVTVSGREGWNACINGEYIETPVKTNGKPVYYNKEDVLFLKFNDSQEWMISRSHDGRCQGCAFNREKNLGNIPTKGWVVSTPDGLWLSDDNISVTTISFLEQKEPAKSGEKPDDKASKSKVDGGFGKSISSGSRESVVSGDVETSKGEVEPKDSKEEEEENTVSKSTAASSNTEDSRGERASSKESGVQKEKTADTKHEMRRMKKDTTRNLKWLKTEMERVLSNCRYDDQKKYIVEVSTIYNDRLSGICDEKNVFIEKLPISFKVSWIGLLGAHALFGNADIIDFDGIDCGFANVTFGDVLENPGEQYRKLLSTVMSTKERTSIIEQTIGGKGLRKKVEETLKLWWDKTILEEMK